MRVLTGQQPEPSLVALGVQTILTRSWSTTYRGPLAIHAGAKRPALSDIGSWRVLASTKRLAWELVHRDAPSDGRPRYEPLPLGAIVATCTLVDVVPIAGMGEETAVRRVEVGTAAGQPNLMLCAPDPTVAIFGDEALALTRDGEAAVDFDASDYYEADVTNQLPYGLFEPGSYAWLLSDVVPVDPPVAFRGGQRLTRTWEP